MWSAILLGLASLLLSSSSSSSASALAAGDVSTRLPDAASLKPDLNLPLCAYTVTTVTGKKIGAGTSSVISLRMENKGGESVFFSELDNGKRHFERGHTDKFDMMGTCVSDLCKMTLYTDDSWDFGDWFVDTVAVSVVTSRGSEKRTWDVHSWLPRDDEAAELFLTVDDCPK
ncbi:hypothetical protein AXG93_2117s1040 [Marchantia polymorpha subsp. ruderalis]|nr:hypothetical protein AXG93_2117s1040 [Marchantia polymorpha subsp. ruderalis]